MSESAERTPAPPGPVAPAASADQPESAHVKATRLQRRPTGTPPPLPHPISVSTTAWVLLAVIILGFAFLFSEITPWRRLGDQANTWVLLRLAEVRTPWLTDVANGINAAGSGWGSTVLGVSVVVLTMVFRRWRHLAVFLGSLFFLEVVAGQLIYQGLTGRARTACSSSAAGAGTRRRRSRSPRSRSSSWGHCIAWSYPAERVPSPRPRRPW